MKKILVIFLIIYSIVLLGCPKMKAIQKAEKASQKLAGLANEGVFITRELFRENVITSEQALKVADLFDKLAVGGIQFDKKVFEIKTFYEKSETQPDKKVLQRLAEFFRADIVLRFVEVLEYLKVIQPNQKLRTIIATIKTAVLVVAATLEIEPETRVDLAGV